MKMRVLKVEGNGEEAEKIKGDRGHRKAIGEIEFGEGASSKA